jgi:MFS family permease
MSEPPPEAEASPSSSWIARELHDRVIPQQRIGKQLAGISLFDAIGSGMYYTGSALYFTTVVGLSASRVGLGLSLGAAAGLVCGVPIGLLADRIPAGRVYIALQVLRGVAFTAFCLVGSFPQFAAVCVLAGITEAALPPVQQAVVGVSVPGEKRVDTLAKVRAVRNVGFGLGALIAAAAIGHGTKTAFLILVAGNAASYFVVAAALWRIGIGKVAVHVQRAARQTIRFVPDARYTLTGLLSGILSVHSTLLVVALPLWFAVHAKMPEALVGILVALNTLMAVVFQAGFARSSTTLPGAVRTALWAGLALAGFGIASQFAPHLHATAAVIAVAFAAVILLTLGELWQSASGWSLSYELADPDRRTAYLSTFQLGQSLQAALAPWLITTLIFPATAGWLVFAAILAGAGLATRLTARPRLPEPEPDPQNTPEVPAEPDLELDRSQN